MHARCAAIATNSIPIALSVSPWPAYFTPQAVERAASVVEFDAFDDLDNPNSSRLAELTPKKAAYAHRSLVAAQAEVDVVLSYFDPDLVAESRRFARRVAAR